MGVRKHGAIEVITGCMFSGKSDVLLKRAERCFYAKLPYHLYKPALDTRDRSAVASRNGGRLEATNVESARVLLDLHPPGEESLSTFIGIDEGQFFESESVEVLPHVVSTLADRGYRVVIAGLNTDHFGDPFVSIANLMALADDVTLLHAICMGCGSLATRTERMVEGGRFVVGSSEYTAKCRSCFVPSPSE